MGKEKHERLSKDEAIGQEQQKIHDRPVDSLFDMTKKKQLNQAECPTVHHAWPRRHSAAELLKVTWFCGGMQFAGSF